MSILGIIYLTYLSFYLYILRKKIYRLYINELNIWPLSWCINKFVSISTVLTFEWKQMLSKLLYLVKSRIFTSIIFPFETHFTKLSLFTIKLSWNILLKRTYRVWTSLLVLVFKKKYQPYNKFIYFIEAHNFKSYWKPSNYL